MTTNTINLPLTPRLRPFTPNSSPVDIPLSTSPLNLYTGPFGTPPSKHLMVTLQPSLNSPNSNTSFPSPNVGKKRRKSTLFKKGFRIQISRHRTNSRPKDDNIGPLSLPRPSISSTSSSISAGSLSSPPISPTTTVFPSPESTSTVDYSEARKQQELLTSASTSPFPLYNSALEAELDLHIPFPFGKAVHPSSTRGRDLGSIPRHVSPCPIFFTTGYGIDPHPGNPVDFSSSKGEANFPYKHRSTSSSTHATDEYHQYLRIERNEERKGRRRVGGRNASPFSPYFEKEYESGAGNISRFRYSTSMCNEHSAREESPGKKPQIPFRGPKTEPRSQNTVSKSELHLQNQPNNEENPQNSLITSCHRASSVHDEPSFSTTFPTSHHRNSTASGRSGSSSNTTDSATLFLNHVRTSFGARRSKDYGNLGRLEGNMAMYDVFDDEWENGFLGDDVIDSSNAGK